MASNQIQMGVNFRKNINSKSASYQKYYAEVDRQKTLTTRGLAAHLKEHNCMVGRDAIQAVLVKLSECIPEQITSHSGSTQLLIKHSHESLPVSRSNMAQVKAAIKREES
jgi:hypothetical protein